jgi:septum formation protein
VTPSEPSPHLVLASRSPQRRAILERLGVPFTVRPADVEELGEGDPGEVALENALRKARAVRRLGAETRTGTMEAVLGCDTLVAFEGVIYGKPGDEREARATLRALSGATHEVVSGVAVLIGDGAEVGGGVGVGGGAGAQIERLEVGHREVAARGRGESVVRTAIARTAVTFRELDEALLDWSLASGEWRGRAGGYAIQGAGAALVRAVEGDYENVVGLPLAKLLDIYPELLMSA